MKSLHAGLFLDRDGTVNTEVDYLRSPDEVVLLPGAAATIREANRAGVKVFIVTNQSGIARGMLTERDLHAVHRRIVDLLGAKGAHVDKIYYCPHHPEYGVPPYRRACDCRKPGDGMLRRAANEFSVDLARSFMVGDRWGDMKAGEVAGCGTVLVLTGYGAAEREEAGAMARIDHVAPSIAEAWKFIQRRMASHAGSHRPSR